MPVRRILLPVSVVLFLAACAGKTSHPSATRSPAGPAGVVNDLGVAQPQKPEQRRDLVPSSVVDALAARDYARALAAAEAASSSTASASPWLEYDRAEALAGLGRTDEAIAAFKAAEQKFRVEPQALAGQSTAIWGRARALAQVGRCPEAARAYGEYATLVGAGAPAAADMAAQVSSECRPLVNLH
jgi:tetratricopeptide (TPR) repeat protein